MKFIQLLKLVERRIGAGARLQILGDAELIGFRITYHSLEGEQQLEKWIVRSDMENKLGNRERTVVNAMCTEIWNK